MKILLTIFLVCILLGGCQQTNNEYLTLQNEVTELKKQVEKMNGTIINLSEENKQLKVQLEEYSKKLKLISGIEKLIRRDNKDISRKEIYLIAATNVKISRHYNFCPILFTAIQKHESRFNPKAISSSGSSGLNQLQPLTAQKMCSRLRLKYDSKMLFDIESNSLLAGKYIHILYKMFGRTETVLAAYNAGELNARAGSNPEYVSMIMKTYSKYKKIVA
jgi:soluble lytic murein transglycosylase-like protein